VDSEQGYEEVDMKRKQLQHTYYTLNIHSLYTYWLSINSLYTHYTFTVQVDMKRKQLEMESRVYGEQDSMRENELTEQVNDIINYVLLIAPSLTDGAG
jgi:hypothetical protein